MGNDLFQEIICYNPEIRKKHARYREARLYRPIQRRASNWQHDFVKNVTFCYTLMYVIKLVLNCKVFIKSFFNIIAKRMVNESAYIN